MKKHKRIAMDNIITKALRGLQNAEEVVGCVSEIADEFDTAKTIIDISQCDFTPVEKACVYRDRLLKLIMSIIIVLVFCFVIVSPITTAFLEAGGVSSVLSLLISGYMTNKASIILEELGLER